MVPECVLLGISPTTVMWPNPPREKIGIGNDDLAAISVWKGHAITTIE